MSISEMKKKQLKYKKNNERLAVPSFQLRGEICGHGTPIQKKERKSCAKKKENKLKTHPGNIPRPI